MSAPPKSVIDLDLELPPPESGTYLPALDGLRALAILLVIPHNVDILSSPLPSYAYPAAVLMHAGWIGVQLFFVLSGFLITGNLLDSRGATNYYSAFFGRRALRILPLYYAVLLFTFVIAPLFLKIPEQLAATQHNQVWLWTFLNNWTQPFEGSVYGFSHFWSLAVEEQFYLLWPFLVRRSTPVSLLRWCAVLTLIAMIVRSLLLEAGQLSAEIYMFTVCRMDALALGAAVAAALRVPSILAAARRATGRITLLALLILFLTAAISKFYVSDDPGSETIGYTLLAAGFALVVMLAALPTQGIVRLAYQWLSFTPLRLIGRYSYAMYVFHMPLHVFIGGRVLNAIVPHVTSKTALLYTIAITLASFLLAALSYHLFERHFLRLKRWFVPQPATAPSP